MKLYDAVALLIDIPDKNLKRGQVGTIVEEWKQGIFEVEFVDQEGSTYAMVAIPAENLMTLHWQQDEARRSA